MLNPFSLFPAHCLFSHLEKWFVCMCVSVCTQVFMCMSVCICTLLYVWVCAHRWMSEAASWLAEEFALHWDDKHVPLYSAFSHGFCRLNLGSHACTARNLPTEPSTLSHGTVIVLKSMVLGPATSLSPGSLGEKILSFHFKCTKSRL